MDVGRIDLNELLHGKSVEALDPAHLTRLQKIQSLNVKGFSEQDVREDIITHLLEALGYAKGSDFSVYREKPLPAVGRNKFPDYRFTLWEKDFWVLEAKKPAPMVAAEPGKEEPPPFHYDAIRQALEYAVHPDINAALIVLCDGRNISVFDREVDIVEPLLTVKITEISLRINELRALLGPWQMWFFEKRRVIRQLNKVFDKEFNLARVEEFKGLVQTTLDSKRSIIAENMRKVIGSPGDELVRAVETASEDEILSIFMPLALPLPAVSAISNRLIALCGEWDFRVINKLFPHYAGPANDMYCTHGLHFLVHLGYDRKEVGWLPAWLGSDKSVDAAIKKYISLCLTYFESERAHRYTLLASAALRRFYKLTMVIDKATWQIGEVMHLAHRYSQREDTFQQLVSSPERHNILRLDLLEQDGLRRLLHICTRDGKPSETLLKDNLEGLWAAELSMLNRTKNYRELLKQRGLDQEIYPTEVSSTVYDNLGHGALCVLGNNVDWKDYALKAHRTEVELLADIGSWRAREMLGLERLAERPLPPAQVLADRFFVSDVKMCRALGSAYGFKVC